MSLCIIIKRLSKQNSGSHFIRKYNIFKVLCFLEERSIPPHKKENSEPNSILKIPFPRFLANFLITSHHYWLNTYDLSKSKLSKKVITVLQRLSTLSADWFIKWLKNDILEWLSRYAHFLITNFLSFADYFLHFCFSYTTDVFQRCT